MPGLEESLIGLLICMRALGTVSAEMLVSAETMVPPGPKCRLSRWQLPYPEMDEKWANIAPRPPPHPSSQAYTRRGRSLLILCLSQLLRPNPGAVKTSLLSPFFPATARVSVHPPPPYLFNKYCSSILSALGPLLGRQGSALKSHSGRGGRVCSVRQRSRWGNGMWSEEGGRVCA